MYKKTKLKKIFTKSKIQNRYNVLLKNGFKKWKEGIEFKNRME